MRRARASQVGSADLRAATWPDIANSAIIVSVVPGQIVGDLPVESLSDLRLALSSRGILSRDLPMRWETVDLGEESGLLALCEQQLTQRAANDRRRGFVETKSGVLVGRGTRIHPTARLIGPLVIHDRASIDEGTTVIGPTVIGSGASVKKGAIIAHSVLMADSVVPAGSTVRQRAVVGQWSQPSTDEPNVRPACVSYRPISTQLPHEIPSTVSTATTPSRQINLTAKRLFDIVLASFGLIITSPLLLAAALAVKLTSPGPVFFKHVREQRGGKEFPCLKFRTMRADAHQMQRELYAQNEVDGPQFKMEDDPRVTAVGRFMRASNIDELPQLFNVLVGHMSLVGPRPSPFRENQICVPWRRARLSVRPGITGLWQICRSDRSSGDFNQWVYYDMLYVRRFSFWLDIKILVATVITAGGKWNVPLSWVIKGEDSSPDTPGVGAPA